MLSDLTCRDPATMLKQPQPMNTFFLDPFGRTIIRDFLLIYLKLQSALNTHPPPKLSSGSYLVEVISDVHKVIWNWTIIPLLLIIVEKLEIKIIGYHKILQAIMKMMLKKVNVIERYS